MTSPSPFRAALLAAIVAGTGAPASPARGQVARDSTEVVSTDALRGKSGRLRMQVLGTPRSGEIAIIKRLFGETAADAPGVFTLQDSVVGAPFSFVTLVPFETKEKGRVADYRMGSWPAEKRRAVRSEAYENPEGFIEVTSSNQDTQVSEHFRLRDFLTHDQQNVWPKYLVLRTALIDKLELVLSELANMGISATRLKVMSGFRTPQYNARARGRARDSRHQFGDAADVMVDSNGDGRMDDLNRDGKVNSKDASVMIEAVNRVEREHPELVGGAGLYRSTRSHSAFVHVDVRGTRARWGRAK